MSSKGKGSTAKLLDAALPRDGNFLPDQGGPSGDILSSVHGQVREVREVMQQNVDQMLTNMAKASALETSSSELANNARAFQRGAKTVRKRMWLDNLKMKLCLGGSCLVIVFLVLWWAGAFKGGGTTEAAAVGANQRRLGLLFS